MATGGTAYTQANAALIAEEQTYCYELRLTGASIRQIAERATEHFGRDISKSTVDRRIQSEIDAKVLPLAAEVRKLEVDRLDMYLQKLQFKVELGDTDAIRTAVRAAERRAKLLGIDAPVQLEVSHVVQTTVDVELEKLAAELGVVIEPVESKVDA